MNNETYKRLSLRTGKFIFKLRLSRSAQQLPNYGFRCLKISEKWKRQLKIATNHLHQVCFCLKYVYSSVLKFPQWQETKDGKMKVTAVSASLLLITFLLNFSFGSGQTFQYSRGWTNGKRSDPFLTYAKHTDAPWNSDDIAANYRLQAITIWVFL